MSASLEKLMENLRKTSRPEKMKVINGCRASRTNDVLDVTKRDLQLSKGLVPWPLISCHEVLHEPRETLPSEQKDYYSVLTDSSPSKEEIKRAAEYYSKYECKNLLQYLMQYCETGMLFENIKTYKLKMTLI